MTTLKASRSQDHKLTIAEILETLSDGMLPLRFSAYDGSAAGPEDAPYGLHLKTTRGRKALKRS
jgi:cyclopropane-fatty-acyl-phospholipid synthase